MTLPELRARSADLAAFDIMFQNQTTWFPTPAPGEFLVPDCIPLIFFRRLVVADEAAKARAFAGCAGLQLPNGKIVTDVLAVDPWRFRGNQ